ncbi:TonB-dependent receptor plug domain-containing protein, partial [Vibrio chagasii]
PTVALAQQAASTPVVATSAATATATLPEAVVKATAPRDDYNAAKSSISKLPENLRDIPQSVTVVPKALTDAQGASSLADALRNVPGIT